MEQIPIFLKTSELALLAGVEPRRVERLLEAENIYLDGILHRPSERKHRLFSLLDPLRVTLVLALNEHGVVPAKVASGIVEGIVDPLPALTQTPDISYEDKLDIRLGALESARAHVWFDEEKEKWTYAAYWDHRNGNREFYGESPKQMAHGERDVYIVVNVARITRDYLARFDKFVKDSKEQGEEE